MKGYRIVGFFSFILVLIVALSAYSPWDFLGLYDKYTVADEYLENGVVCYCSGRVFHKENKGTVYVYYVDKATIEVENVRLKNISFILKSDSDCIPLNGKIAFCGKIKLFEQSRNEGNFNEKDYYNSLGFVCYVINPKELEISTTVDFDLLYRFQQSFSEVFKQGLAAEEAGFVAAITVGDKSFLDKELKQLFQYTGLAHILAVSGLHISFLCKSIYEFLRKRGVSYLFSGVSVSVITLLYVIMTGGSVSAKRAAGMFLIYLLSQILGEAYDIATALGVMSVILLADNPLYIKNTSFLFSFGAILSVVYVAKPLFYEYQNYYHRILDDKVKKRGIEYRFKRSIVRNFVEKIMGSFVFSLAMTIGCLPLVMGLFYAVPRFGVFVNIILLPMMPVILGLGLLGGITGVLGLHVSKVFLRASHFIIFFFEMLADCISRINGSQIITGKPKALWSIVYILIVLFLIYGLRDYRVKCICLVAVAILFMHSNKQGFEIDILDVGQGDGIYICSGDGSNFFIDGGSTSEKELGEYRIYPFLKYKGAAKIDYWFVSHPDEDHISGLIEIIQKGYPIKNIVVSENFKNRSELDELCKLASAYKINILFMSPGEVCRTKHLSFLCLNPLVDRDGADINKLCLCLGVYYDKNCDGKNEFSGFFGGDISKDEELKIIEKYRISDIDYLKVSHHGSASSSAEEFVKRLNPKYVSISCSKHNSYGHPSASVVDIFKERGCNIFYTMDNGQIIIKYKNKLWVESFLNDN